MVAGNDDRNDHDKIDEQDIETPTNDFIATANTGYHLVKTLGDIAKLFIVLSFAFGGLIVLVGLWNPEYSKEIFSMIWDKIAAVYLVIFGHWLGRK